MEWQNILQILTSKLEPLKEIMKKKVKHEKELMSSLWSDPNIKKLVNLWLMDHYEKRESKSVAKAQTFKTLGNKAFQEKNYVDSIGHYTKCASYAPLESNELAVAIANRSAALFYLGRYDDCIQDIKLAIELNYPKHLHCKLYLREAQCYSKLGKQQLMEDVLSKINELLHDPNYIAPTMKDSILKKINEMTLTTSYVQSMTKNNRDLLQLKSQMMFKENVNFPYASASIDRKYNDKSGRYVVANRFIKTGDVLFLERPVSFVLLDQSTLHDLCQNCNCSTAGIPVPCTECVNTFYCNKTCSIEALSLFHQWECPGSQMKLWNDIGIGHLALKVLLTCATTTDKIKFNEMQNLVTNFDKLSMDDLTIYGITAIMLTTYLSKYTDFFEANDIEDCLMDKFFNMSFNATFNISTEDDKRLYISSLLLRYILQLIGNGHAITRSGRLRKDGTSIIEQDIVATGIYPSASMMNHSCDPNIINIFLDQYLIVKASRDIAIHEEIFNCYGPHYRHMTTEDRQRILKSQYCFSCKCKPCIEPKLQYFLERFNAIKCTKCNGALCHVKKSMFCIDCSDTSQSYFPSKIMQAQEIFEEAQASLESGKTVDALKMLEKSLNIRQAILYKHNKDIVATLNLIAEINKVTGRFMKSIKCLEGTIAAITERFGSASIELLNQLNELIDVYTHYFQEEENVTTNQYKNMQRKYKKYLDQQRVLHSLIIGDERALMTT